jgi:sigma-E factor negative regulatory protein RseA
MTMKNECSLPLEEQLSAFVDGELAPDALTQLVVELSQQDTLREDWYAYHVVGDVLRSASLSPGDSDAAFWSRLEQRLANEPARPTQAPPDPMTTFRSDVPANQRWAWLAGAALSVVVVTVSWGLWQRDIAPAEAQLASAVPATVVATAVPDEGSVMIRDPHLDALMQAHQQLGGHSAWQMPSGFLRNATYVEPPR